jgi:Uma2 family endonuclease
VVERHDFQLEVSAGYDRDGKFQAYKQIASLEEYVLVSQDERCVEVFRRAHGWRGEILTAGATFIVHGASVAVDAVYGD